MSDVAKLVITTFPENRNMQLVCLRIPLKFRCCHCNAAKRAKMLAVASGDWERLLCEGCYTKLLAEPLPAPTPAEQAESDECDSDSEER